MNLQAMPCWIHFLAALKPTVLVKGYSAVLWPNLTKPLPFVLESKGPFFVEYTIISSKARRGTPTIGLVDAEFSLSAMPTGEWPLDLSRSQAQGVSQDKTCFAISFSPGCAFSNATIVEGNSSQLLGGAITTCTHDGRSEKCSFRAKLNWETLGDESESWNAPIQAGFFLENGCLSFWRKVAENWHSTGVICQALPPKVLPCMFLSFFSGYACVRFSGLSNGPPGCCSHCDASGHGTADGWKAWKPLSSQN